MIHCDEIKKYYSLAIDKQATENLIDKIDKLKNDRRPFFLDLNDFYDILYWKLYNQFYRLKRFILKNTDDEIKSVTKNIFNIQINDEKQLTELRLKKLDALPAVGIPVASAILAITYPEKYCVIDFRIWRQIFNEKRTTFTIKNYLDLLNEVLTISKRCGLTPQKVDLA